MTILRFSSPRLLSDEFDVPADSAIWPGATGTYSDCYTAAGHRAGRTPNRERASFSTLGRALRPKTHHAETLRADYGVYVMAFNSPRPAIYVGITAGRVKSPEGILRRLQKHRVKLTSSHVGAGPTKTGGVDHTLGWRNYAAERSNHFASLGKEDRAADGQFMIGSLLGFPEGMPDKPCLEWIERQLKKNGPLWTILGRCFWQEEDDRHVVRLTTQVHHGQQPESPQVIFPDGQVFDGPWV
jgi:hypothetical protein